LAGAGQVIVVADDRARFEQLFTSHYAALVRYALRRVGSDGAQEIVAETFVVAWRRLDDVPENALPWLYATARRVMANELRRRSREQRLGRRLESMGVVVAPDHADAVTEQLRIRAALAQLGLRDQEVLRLAEWERLGTADAAAVMGCSQSALKVRLHRARRRLAAVLERSGDVVPRGLIHEGDKS
jgi:RNA polymerase sigma-70 factor, ECF subfamily